MSKKNGQKDLHGTANDLVSSQSDSFDDVLITKAAALQQEKVMAPGPSSRSDLGEGRPISRHNTAQDFPRAHNNYPAPNPAKPPAKRLFEPDHEDELARPIRVQGGQSYQQNDTKRRRTEDEEIFEAPVRPTMAPPIRQSNIRKVCRALCFGMMEPPTNQDAGWSQGFNLQQQLHYSTISVRQPCSRSINNEAICHEPVIPTTPLLQSVLSTCKSNGYGEVHEWKDPIC